MSKHRQPRFSAKLKHTPFWWEAAPRNDETRDVVPQSVDVAIVGSGFTGMSAALTLARSGCSVAVFDSGEPGCGASTRNGGQVGSGNQKFSVKRVEALYGVQKASHLLNEGADMLQYIADMIEREGIECGFRRCGRFRGAVHPSHYEKMARDLEDLQKVIGVEFNMVSRRDQYNEVGTEYYYGGSVLPDDACLHPGLLHSGLMERAQKAGAKIYGHNAISDIQTDGKKHVLSTSEGHIVARSVIIATNGYTGAPFKRFKQRIVPIESAVITTQELPDELIKHIMPQDRVYGNTARMFHYFRPCHEGKRLIWGGRVERHATENTSSAFIHLWKDMVNVFPDLASAEITHGWVGKIGYTFDSLPHLGCLDGIHFALGYCGTGVSRSTYFGNKIALKVLNQPGHETAFDDLPLPTHPLHWGSRIGVPMIEAYYRVMDRFFP